MQKRFRLFVALVLACTVLSQPLSAHAADPAPIYLSEIGWAGSSVSAADEWFELTNRSEEQIDLSGWTVGGAATSGGTLILPPGAIIEPHGVFLIANYAPEHTSSTLAVQADYVTTSVSLSNSALALTLRDANGLTVDVAGDGGTPAAGRSGSDHWVSMQRVSPDLVGRDDGSWTDAIESIGFDPMSLELGDPGTTPLPDVPEPEIVEPVPEPDPPAEEPVLVEPEPKPEAPIVTPEEPALVIEPEPIIEPDPVPAQSEEPVAAKPEPIPEPTPVSYPVGTLILNEFVSDPVSGELEWVEVVNPYNNVIPLDGWVVRESSGRRTPLPDTFIGYGQFAVASFSGSALNNDRDTIELVDPTGVVIDTLIYGNESIPSVADPNAVARTSDGSWIMTDAPTPGAANQFPILEPTDEPTESTPADPVEPEVAITITNEPDAQTIVEEPEAITPVLELLPQISTTYPDLFSLRLSEVYPNTEGSDAEQEFIELEWLGVEPVDLMGISLEDGSGARWTLESSRLIESNAFVMIPRREFGFALNNTGEETVRLFDNQDVELDRTSFENPPSGFSIARSGTDWEWTSDPTPGEANRFASPVEESAPRSTGTGSKKSRPLSLISLASAREIATGERVRTQGIVTVPPGPLGEQLFYITEDGAAIQVFKSDGEFPELAIGDEIELTGTRSNNRGQARIKIGKDDLLIVLGSGPEPEPVETTSLSESLEGMLVRVVGSVVRANKERLILSVGDETITIRARSGELDLSGFAPGTQVEATGIATQVDANFSLMPRSNEDLYVLGSTALAATTGTKTEADATSGQIGWVLTLTALAGLTALYIRHRRNAAPKPVYEPTHELPIADPARL